MPLTSPGNDDGTGENHQPTLRKNTAEPAQQTLKQYNERPATDDDRVFVRYKAPHVALRGHSSVYEAISRVMRHAGLGRRGGSRLLRRNAATRMLEAATPLPTISAVLGHADPDSTRVYMATHRGGMLACVLPVPEGGSS